MSIGATDAPAPASTRKQPKPSPHRPGETALSSIPVIPTFEFERSAVGTSLSVTATSLQKCFNRLGEAESKALIQACSNYIKYNDSAHSGERYRIPRQGATSAMRTQLTALSGLSGDAFLRQINIKTLAAALTALAEERANKAKADTEPRTQSQGPSPVPPSLVSAPATVRKKEKPTQVVSDQPSHLPVVVPARKTVVSEGPEDRVTPVIVDTAPSAVTPEPSLTHVVDASVVVTGQDDTLQEVVEPVLEAAVVSKKTEDPLPTTAIAEPLESFVDVPVAVAVQDDALPKKKEVDTPAPSPAPPVVTAAPSLESKKEVPVVVPASGVVEPKPVESKKDMPTAAKTEVGVLPVAKPSVTVVITDKPVTLPVADEPVSDGRWTSKQLSILALVLTLSSVAVMTPELVSAKQRAACLRLLRTMFTKKGEDSAVSVVEGVQITRAVLSAGLISAALATLGVATVRALSTAAVAA